MPGRLQERRTFHRTYRLQYPKACERLDRDWARMITYYNCSEAHWRHLRTTNVVELPFAAVRLRTSAAKRFIKVEHATAIIWRLLCVAESRFRKLNAPELCAAVYRGARYHDGVAITTTELEQAEPRRDRRKFPRLRDWEHDQSPRDEQTRAEAVRGRGA